MNFDENFLVHIDKDDDIHAFVKYCVNTVLIRKQKKDKKKVNKSHLH